MTFTAEQIQELRAPLSRDAVKSREQAGRKLSYVEAYHVENEANRIFGFDAWDRETEMTPISEAFVGDKHRVYYRAKVKITVRTPGGGIVVREGCGYGSGIDKDLGQAHESALKEAESDAEKRALKTFGNPFGQALYDKEQSQVADASQGAEEAAKNLLRGASADQGLFKEAWLKNQEGWKRLLPPESYARVVKVMQECAAKFPKAAKVEDDPFREGGPGRVAADDHPDREFNASPGSH